jgi:hypothetical protein
MEGQDSPVHITINDRKIKMVADTGCRQNIISSQLYREQFKEHPLESTAKQFVAYGQKVPLTCLGRFKANLKAGMMTIHSFVSAKGIQPDPVKTKAIQEGPPPANVAELRRLWLCIEVYTELRRVA